MTAHAGDGGASFVVPAHNAAATLAETLASIRAQTLEDWEAVIVDDGSTDDTAAIAERWSRDDSRFRVLRQPNGGHAAARNAAIGHATREWLAFLDSDDWVAPNYLQAMLGRAARPDEVDAVVCGCVRVSAAGEHGEPSVYEPSSLADPFPQFAVDCPVAIHNCMVKRAIVVAIGGFDVELGACADWDLWQRVARTGARFGTVPDVLAYYRMRPGSVSTNSERALVHGWTVIRRGHATDARVPKPDARWVAGVPAAGLPEALYRQAVWAASIALAQGKDARTLLALMGDQRAATIEPGRVAQWLFEYVPFACSRDASEWPALWPQVAARLDAYLEGLETQAGAARLARQTRAGLERLIAGLPAATPGAGGFASADAGPPASSMWTRMKRAAQRLARPRG